MSALKRPHLLVVGAILAVLCLGVFGRAMRSEFVRWDDGLLIYENPAAQGFSMENIKAAFTTYDPELYIPLTLLSYQLDYTISGANPVLYHLDNLFLHILGAIAVYASFVLLTHTRRIAFLVALLFAIHPLNTEAVVWASGRKDVLSTMLFFVALAFALHGQQSGSKRSYWLSVVAITLGMMAKATVVVFPAILLLTDWYQRKPIFTKEQLLRYVPYGLLSGLFLTIAVVGKTRVLGASNPVEKMLMAPRSLVFYLEKILWPQDLAVLYPWEGSVHLGNPIVLTCLVIFSIVLITSIAALKWSRLPLFAFAFFCIGVAPTLINFAKGDMTYFASDRYAYLGAVGIFFFAAVLLDRFLRKDHLFAGGVAVLTVILVPVTFVQAGMWKDSQTLFHHVVDTYPTTVVAYNNLANVERDKGLQEVAAAHYATAVQLLENPNIRAWHSDRIVARLYGNYASLLRQQNHPDQARVFLNKALVLDPGNVVANVQMGVLLADTNDLAGAEQYYRAAIAADPQGATAHLNLGALFMAKGDVTAAVAEYEKAIELNPYSVQAYYNLGIAERSRNRPRQAAAAYQKALELAPQFTAAHINLGILYYERKDTKEAIAEFEAVLQYEPGNKKAKAALTQIQAQ